MKRRLFFIVLLSIVVTGLTAQQYDFKAGQLYYKITDHSAKTVSVVSELVYPLVLTPPYPPKIIIYTTEPSGAVVIPEKVTNSATNIEYVVNAIGDYAFAVCYDLTSITIPSTITTIGSGAFRDCRGLSSVTIPNSVTTIGRNAFESCFELTTIDIPNSVINLGERAFQYCTKLVSATIGNSVTRINDATFYYCWELSSVTISNSVTNIATMAFYDCRSLTVFDFPEALVEIGENAFRSCNLKHIVIPNFVTSLKKGVFEFCSNIERVSIGSGLSDIGNLFHFVDGGKLKQYVVSKDNNFFKDIDGVLYSKDEKTILSYPPAKIGSRYEISSSVTKIASFAFFKSSNLFTVIFPSSLTEIDDGAFHSCINLNSLTFPHSLQSIGSSSFSGCKTFESVILPNSLMSVGEFAFLGCINLETVFINGALSSIGGGVFYMCSNLKTITVAETNSAYSDIDGVLFTKDKKNLLLYPIGKVEESYNIPQSVNKIENKAFSGCEILKSIIIPNSVTSIGNGAFENCKQLTEIVLPDNIQTISPLLFSNCTSLVNISVPNSVTEVGYSAFAGCELLKSISLPNSITRIGSGAFDSSGIITMLLPVNIVEIEAFTFHRCINLESIRIPSKVEVIGNDAFSGCGKLKSLTVLSQKPPRAFPIFFEDPMLEKIDFANCKLIVPSDAIIAYRNAVFWKEFVNIVSLSEKQFKIVYDEELAGISPNFIAPRSDVFYYYKLRDVENNPAENIRVVLDINGKIIYGEPSDEYGLAVVHVPVYGNDITDGYDDIIPPGQNAEIKISYLTDESKNSYYSLTEDSNVDKKHLTVSSFWALSDLNVKLKGGVKAEAGWKWAKVGANVDLSLGAKVSYKDNEFDKIKVTGALDGGVDGELKTPNTLKNNEISIGAGISGGVFLDVETNDFFQGILYLLRDAIIKDDAKDPASLSSAMVFDYLTKYKGAEELVIGNGAYWGISGDFKTNIFKDSGLKQTFNGQERNFHVKLDELSFNGNASIKFSNITKVDKITNLKNDISETEIEFGWGVGSEAEINSRWKSVNKWENLTYPLRFQDGFPFTFKGMSDGQSRTFSFSLAVSKQNGYCNELKSEFEDKLEYKFQLSKILQEWLDLVNENAGFDVGAKFYRNNKLTLKSKEKLASSLYSNPSVGYALFPINDNWYNFDVAKQYDFFLNSNSLPQGLYELANSTYSDKGLDKDLTYELENNYGINIYTKWPIFNYKVFNLFFQGGLSFDVTLPRFSQYYERESGKMLTGYLTSLITDDDGTDFLKTSIDSFNKKINDGFEANRSKVQNAIDKTQNSLVGAGVNYMEFSNASIPRQVSRVLSNYSSLKTQVFANRTIVKFSISALTFDVNENVYFRHFYSGGDMVGQTQFNDTITAVSDIFSLLAEDNEGNPISIVKDDAIHLSVSFAKEDLNVLGFSDDSPVHLYYMHSDSITWTDMGTVSEESSFYVNKLGYYILGTLVMGDHEPPVITTHYDISNNQIIINVRDNLAMSSSGVKAFYNGYPRDLIVVSNNTYFLQLEEHENKEYGLLQINAFDIAGNLSRFEMEINSSQTNINNTFVGNEDMKIYPNPTKNSLTIELPKKEISGEIEILDISGNLLTKLNVENKQTIDISAFKRGVYFVRLRSYTQKFIKQ